MITRRSFLTALAGLPLVGKMIPQQHEWHVELAYYNVVRDEYVTVPWYGKLYEAIGRDTIERAKRSRSPIYRTIAIGGYRLRRTTSDTWRYSPPTNV